MTTDHLIPGGYTPFRKLTDKEKVLFKTVLDPLVGVDYEAVAVATQVVAGVNLKFFCNASVVKPDSPYYAAMITIFQPLPKQGDAHITGICKINC